MAAIVGGMDQQARLRKSTRRPARKAAEALINAAKNREKAEEVHPIGYFNAMARRAMEERAEKLRYDPRGPRGRNN